MSRWRCNCGFIVDNNLMYGDKCPKCDVVGSFDKDWVHLDCEESERLWEEQEAALKSVKEVK